MKIRRVLIDQEFKDQFLRLPLSIQKRADKARVMFSEDPFHPSLRLHKLSGKLEGCWSISVNRQYRMMFRFIENGVALFISIGTHAIYK